MSSVFFYLSLPVYGDMVDPLSEESSPVLPRLAGHLLQRSPVAALGGLAL